MRGNHFDNKGNLESSLAYSLRSAKRSRKEISGSVRIASRLKHKAVRKPDGGIEKLVLQEEEIPHMAEYGDRPYLAPILTTAKSLYSGFSGYASKAYEAVNYASEKVDTFVRLTFSKMIKLHERILAALNPQWNKVMGSPEDLDTHSRTVSQKESVSEENRKYHQDYKYLRYRN